MRIIPGLLFAMIAVLGVSGLSVAQTAKHENSTLAIFHSNDLIGYLTPCG